MTSLECCHCRDQLTDAAINLHAIRGLDLGELGASGRPKPASYRHFVTCAKDIYDQVLARLDEPQVLGCNASAKIELAGCSRTIDDRVIDRQLICLTASSLEHISVITAATHQRINAAMAIEDI